MTTLITQLQARIDEWQKYRDNYPSEACCATARIDTLIETIALLLGSASVPLSEASGSAGRSASAEKNTSNCSGEAPHAD